MRIGSSKFIKFANALVKEAERLPEYSSKFSRKDYTLRQHLVLLCLKIKLKQRYREFCEILDLMPEIKRILGLDKTPHWTTLDKVFLRLKNHVFAALLQIDSRYASIDATSFDRGHMSIRYQLKCKRVMKGVKTTFLVDHDQNIIDLHCTTTHTHDSQIVLPLTRKHRLRVLCADKGYDDAKVRRALRATGTRPLIPYREFKNKRKQVYWNSLFDKKLYHKRSFCETVNSVIKRKYSDTLYSKNWRNQFKELTLLAVVYNIDRKARILLEVFYRAD